MFGVLYLFAKGDRPSDPTAQIRSSLTTPLTQILETPICTLGSPLWVRVALQLSANARSDRHDLDEMFWNLRHEIFLEEKVSPQNFMKRSLHRVEKGLKCTYGPLWALSLGGIVLRLESFDLRPSLGSVPQWALCLIGTNGAELDWSSPV